MTNGDVEGAVAVNGDFVARNSFGVGDKLVGTSQCLPGAFNLIVNGNLDYTKNGQVFCGSALVPASTDIISSPNFRQTDAKVVTGSISSLANLDFESERSFLLSLSSTLCNTKSTAVTVRPYNILWASSDSSASSIFFSINLSDLNSANYFKFNLLHSPSEIIINVVGTGKLSLSNFRIEPGSLPESSILFNICDASSVTVENLELPGSLLAPKSQLTLQNAQIVGNVVVQTIYGPGSGEIHFAPCV